MEKSIKLKDKCIFLVIGLFCLNLSSKGYNNIFEKSLMSKIDAKNEVLQRYISEGVYSFDYTRVKTTSSKNKFGEWVTVNNRYPAQKGEISFTSKKIVIILGDRTEEFIISPPVITGYTRGNNDFFAYEFKVISWKAFSKNVCFYKYESIDNPKYRQIMGERFFEPFITLTITTRMIGESIKSDSQISFTESVSGYDLNRISNPYQDDYIIVPLERFGVNAPPMDSDTDNSKFIFDMVSGTISMNRLETRYNVFNTPEYVSNPVKQKINKY